MTARITGVLAIAIALLWTACEKSPADVAPAAGAAAGEVVEVSGAVSVEREGKTAVLAQGAQVFASDVVITGADGAVTIRLFHNNAAWSLGAGKRKQVEKSVAWRAPKQAAGDLLASGESGEGTAAAGRQSERQAGDTSATARAPGGAAPPMEAEEESGPPPAAAVAPPPPPAKQAPRRPAKKKMVKKGAPNSRGIATIKGNSRGSGGAAGDPLGGAGGLGLKGTGRGGGGTGTGTIGLGNVGTIGKGGGGSGGSGYGRGSGGLKGRSSAVPKVRTGSANVSGALDKDIIRRVVRRHLARMRACYEGELKKDPKAAGKAVLEFTIGAKGSVVAAKTTGNLAPKIGACLTAATKAMTFPQPKGGGIVTVKYPMVFAPSN